MKQNHNDPSFGVGHTYINKQGLTTTVIEYLNNKNVTVQFEDGTKVKTNVMYIKEGRPLHPTFGYLKVGETYKCKYGDTVEVIEVINKNKYKVKFLSDGRETVKDKQSIVDGTIAHENNRPFKVGQEVETNMYGIVKVIKINSAKDVVVMFSDGVTVSVSANNLKRGSVQHPTCFLLGNTFTTNSGHKFEVIEYHLANKVKVRWEDGSESIENSGNIRSGNIKPKMKSRPTLYGVGVDLGIPYTTKKSRLTRDKILIPEYIRNYWLRILDRCYNPTTKAKDTLGLYKDATVCEEWHDFQNFAKWALDQKGVHNGWDIEKDLLGFDKKHYSPETACFLPSHINSFINKGFRTPDNMGANYIKPTKPNAKEGWIARCSIFGDRKYLGFYPTIEQAQRVYAETKRKFAKELADFYKEQIDERAYNALIEFSNSSVEDYMKLVK